jgi:hypothetical protein
VGTQVDLMLPKIWLKMWNASISDSQLLPSDMSSYIKGARIIVLHHSEIMVFGSVV